MLKIIEIIALIVLPLAWGLLVEHLFQKWRGKPHVLRTKATENPSDWTI